MSNHSLPEELQEILEDLCNDLTSVFRAHLKTLSIACEDYKDWLSDRKTLITQLSEIQTDLSEHHKKVNIANVAGSSVSLASGAACIGGLVLAPFTAGASLVLSAGGLVGTAAGTLTAVGADVAEHFLKKGALQKAEEALQKDCQNTENLIALIELRMKTETKATEQLRSRYSETLGKYLPILETVMTGPEERDVIERIRNGRGWFEDYVTLLSVCLNRNSMLFEELKRMKSFKMGSAAEGKASHVISSLARSTVSGIQCAKLFTTLRSGSTVLRVASKIPTIASSALIGISMIPDVVNIVFRAKDIHSKEETSEIKRIQDLIEILREEENHVSEYFGDCC